MALAHVDQWLLQQNSDCIHDVGKVFYFADPEELSQCSLNPKSGIFNTEDLNIDNEYLLSNVTRMLKKLGLYLVCRLPTEADVVIFGDYEYGKNYSDTDNQIEMTIRSFEREHKKIFRTIEDAIELRSYTVISDNLF